MSQLNMMGPYSGVVQELFMQSKLSPALGPQLSARSLSRYCTLRVSGIDPQVPEPHFSQSIARRDWQVRVLCAEWTIFQWWNIPQHSRIYATDDGLTAIIITRAINGVIPMTTLADGNLPM
jgi:hypothetical protein